MISVSESFILLNKSIRAIFLTLFSKRYQLRQKNDLLIMILINTACLTLLNKLAFSLSKFLD